MITQNYKSNLYLFLAAIIWGFSFVAQRAGMEHIGPFTFNGIRFALGSLSLVPLLFIRKEKRQGIELTKHTVFAGIAAGTVLFIAASFQQIGIIYTTAGNAGFITGLYVVLVPMLGIFIRQKTAMNVWVGALFAAFGMYILSVKGGFSIEFGDALVLVSALFFASHILLIGRYSSRVSAIKLSITQFAVCSVFSLAVAISIEEIVWSSIVAALIPIVYGGVFSVGIAYTLQVIGQRKAHPSSASIILSLEAVFAVFGGWLFLNEMMSMRGLIGCGLMLMGMILAQVSFARGRNLFKL